MSQSQNDKRSRAWLLVGLMLFVAGACWWLMRWKNEAAAQQLQAQREADRLARAARWEAAIPPVGGFDSLPIASAVDDSPADASTTNEGKLFGVTLSQPVADLLPDVSPKHAGLAVRDDAGNVYYARRYMSNDLEKDGVFRLDPSGEEVIIWSTKADDTHLEIAGLHGEHLVLVDVAGPPLTAAAQAWQAQSTWGLGTRTRGIGVWPDHGHQELKAHFRASPY